MVAPQRHATQPAANRRSAPPSLLVLVGSSSAVFHAIGAGSIAVIVVFSLVVLLDLSYPFAGTFAIDYDPLRTGVLERFDIPPR
jgi:hypothetical protein